jgi:hypothetical protein
MSTTTKAMIAAIATVTAAFAFAQGNPPNPAVSNPAQGAGQRSSQNTPMGTTGTPGGGATAQGSGTTGGTMSSGATAGSTAAANAGTGAGSTASSSNMSGGTTMASGSGTGKAKKAKRARADRG